MKVNDLTNIFSKYTSVKIVENGVDDVFRGYFLDIPKEYQDRNIDMIIPIVNPGNTRTGMTSIILERV